MNLISRTRPEIKNKNFIVLPQYIKENSSRIFAVLLISAVWYVLMVLPYYMIIKPSMPESAAEDYILHLKGKNYDKALECYIEIPKSPIANEYYIKNVLKNTYENVSDIRVKRVEVSSKLHIFNALLEIDTGNRRYEENISIYNTGTQLYGLKKDWKIVFPFKTRDVSITSVSGAKVFIDDVEAGIIEQGKFTAHEVIFGKHSFSVQMGNIGKSDNIEIEVNDNSNNIELGIKPAYEFKNRANDLISCFCRGWAEYCLSTDAEKIKPYLTERLFKEYTGDTERFNGSKYDRCEYNIDFMDLSIISDNEAYYTVDEKWQIKEVITDPKLVFKDNNKSELEQIQYIKWKYHMVNDKDIWKIDSAEQLDFKQEIKK